MKTRASSSRNSMYRHARDLEFEEAAKLRDEIGQPQAPGAGDAGMPRRR